MPLPPLPPVFTSEEARGLGLTSYRLTRLVRSGHIRRIRKGTYTLTETVEPDARASNHVLLAKAALTQRGPHHALSHLSAAAMHGLPLPLGSVDTVHLTSLCGTPRTRRAAGLWVHHANSSETQVELVGELLTTIPARTVADCLRHFPPRVGVPIADAALHRGLTRAGDVEDQLNMQCHWVGRAKHADEATPLVDGRRESWLESYAAVVFHEWGIDPPTPQLIVLDARSNFVARTDAGWQEDGTVIELDGKSKYRLPAASEGPDPRGRWEEEKERYDQVGNLGLERVRFGLTHLREQPELVRQRIRDRRAAGSFQRFTGTFRVLPDSGLVIRSIWDPQTPQD